MYHHKLQHNSLATNKKMGWKICISNFLLGTWKHRSDFLESSIMTDQSIYFYHVTVFYNIIEDAFLASKLNGEWRTILETSIWSWRNFTLYECSRTLVPSMNVSILYSVVKIGIYFKLPTSSLRFII